MRALMMGLALGTTVAGLATSVGAQTFERTLPSGRSLVIPASIDGCERASMSGASSGPARPAYVCQVASEQNGARNGRAEVSVVFMRDPLAPTPRDYLLGQSRQWWPGLSDADRMSNITREEKRLANGQAAFWCLYRDDVMNLAGDAICVLDTPDAELVLQARSTMAFTADEGVDAVLAGVSLR